MMMKLGEKDIKILKKVSLVAGIFTLLVATIMIFAFFQLKSLDPLNNPAFVSLKNQFDNNQDDAMKAAQVRALDLMARKAYFTTRGQVQTGSYIMLAGAIIFVFCQRMISDNEGPAPEMPGPLADPPSIYRKYRKVLLASAVIISTGGVAASFLLRGSLPDLSGRKHAKAERKTAVVSKNAFKPGAINFPQFRGENSRGIAGGSGYPTAWDYQSGKNIKWKVRIPGAGKSSPVIWEEQLFITSAEGTQCSVFCYNKNTGELLWKASASGIEGEPTSLPRMSEDGGIAVSTAAVNAKAVCAIFANGNLISLDHKGNKLWATNLGVPGSTYGYSSSLLIYENTLIVQYESEQKLSLIGFDVENGSKKWETSRSGRTVWSSPVLAEFSNSVQVVLNGNPATSGYDAATGKLLWSIDCLSGDVAPSVAVNSTMAYSVTDYAKLSAIIPGEAPSVKWEDNTYTPDVSSPVATDEYLFVATGIGDVACYNAQAGDTLWSHYFMDPFYASPVIADGKVWFLDRAGKMHIVKYSDRFELVSEAALGEAADCTPAFSEGSVFIRGKENLFCISAK
jgi:outer membrane protein assembly factor BamB